VPTDIAAKIIRELCENDDTPGFVHLIHPRPTKWMDMIQVVASSLQVDVQPYPKWLEKLSVDEDVTANPALKLLPFFQSVNASPPDPAHEALGVVRLQSEKGQASSSTLADLTPLQKQDIEKWVKYWRSEGHLDH
jgi:hypothetical protein